MSETIRVSGEVKLRLLEIISKIQEETGERADFDDAVRYLLNLCEKRDRTVLRSLVGCLGGLDIEAVRKERAWELGREKEKYGV